MPRPAPGSRQPKEHVIPRRNVGLLSLCYALGLAGAPLVVLVGGIAGTTLAPRAALVTAPIAAMVVGTAIATVPASVLMSRVGRRRGFFAAALVAAGSSLTAAWALEIASFWLFCLGTLGLGMNLAFVQQYRFAAAESVGAAHVGRAVSIVLAGGIVAALVGPELAGLTETWSGHPEYVLSFVVLAAVYGGVALVLLFLRDVKPHGLTQTGERRPIRTLIGQPVYVLAVVAATVAYGVMSFVMTATPVSMHALDSHSQFATKLVIQSHMLGMYVPTLVAGVLIARLGLGRVLTVGLGAMIGGVLAALAGHAVGTYWTALVLVGVGWSLLFVGATVLLTRTYRPAERFRAQAVNDLCVFSVQAVASLSAGAVLLTAGWEGVNLLMLAPLAALGSLLLFWRRHATEPAAEAVPTPTAGA